MLGIKKSVRKMDYNPEEKTPVIRCSICTGEQVGCLKSKTDGRLEEIMLIRSEQDLKEFQKMTGTKEIPKVY